MSDSPQASGTMEESKAEEGTVNKTSKPSRGAGGNFCKLSAVSQRYDMDGDGKLDDVELAMRNMDTSNRGHLSNETVFKLMQAQVEQQKQLFKFKKIMIVLSALVFLLTLSNLGTSFAAAYLAKDTTVNAKGELVNSNSKGKISTQSTNDQFTVLQAAVDETGDRRLRFCDSGRGRNNDLCEVDSYMYVDIAQCRAIIEKCRNNNVVTLLRTFSNGDTVQRTICRSETAVLETRRLPGNIVFRDSRQSVDIHYVEDDAGNRIGCMLMGDVLLQDEGEVCDVGADCGRLAQCRQMTAESVSDCASDCRASGRTNEARIRRCENGCDIDSFHKTCQMITQEPTMFPSISTRPSTSPTGTFGPTSVPSLSPTLSAVPSTANLPSLSPSISTAPSKSSQPTNDDCPLAINLMTYYGAGDRVTNSGQVMECDSSQFTPTSSSCHNRWKTVGTCDNGRFVPLGCPADYDAGASYVVGVRVTSGEIVFECRDAPCESGDWDEIETCPLVAVFDMFK